MKAPWSRPTPPPRPAGPTDAARFAESLRPIAERAAADIGDSHEAWRGAVIVLGTLYHVGDAVAAAHPEDVTQTLLAMLAALTAQVPR